MPYGIAHLSVVPVRNQAEDAAEMCTQLLYGEHFRILEKRKFWSRIRVAYDKTEGWISNTQYQEISEEEYTEIERGEKNHYVSDLVSYASAENHSLIPLLLGASVGHLHLIGQQFEGSYANGTRGKSQLVDTALMYLNAPFVSGGKTPFGIDSAGLNQMVYKNNGNNLLRDAAGQAKQGEALSFIEESEEGDLAFFDNNEGIIDHVGIIMRDNYIIHAHGKVRIDRIDHTGIFNAEQGRYSHPLRVIKKIA